jgi:hypothetical protein
LATETGELRESVTISPPETFSFAPCCDELTSTVKRNAASKA